MSTRGKLIEAYLSIVESDGFHAVSVGNLTKKVGITKSSFYAHFPSIESIEDAVITFCMNKINTIDFKIDYKSQDAEELFVKLINSFIDTFSPFPVFPFLVLTESRKLNSDKFRQISDNIDLMITARLTVALDFCVQRSWSNINDTDEVAKILTPFIRNLIINPSLSDEDLTTGIRTILKLTTITL